MALPAKREPTTLPELFDRLSDWRWPFARPWPDLWRAVGTSEMPAVDMFKENGNIVVKAQIPGAKPDEIDASIDDDVLTIRRQHKEEKEEKDKDYYYKEQRSESFVRELQLPERVDQSKTQADLKDGMLTIKMVPAGPSPSASKITIKS